ncbi:hypothetical protein Tco_0170167 [Tanacetum coccineum]
MIIFHLQRKYKFHPRPESPLHLLTEEPILGYLKFSAKGTKREVFGMPILNELVTDDIRGADYYNAYLKKVANHHRYLTGEEVSDPDSPAPKPAKSTKPQITKQTKPVAPKVATKKPQPAPTKLKEKKQADTQRAIEESMKDAYGAHRGPLPLVVFRETDTGKYQPLPERRTSAPTEPSGHDESSSLYAELGLTESDTKSDEEVPPIVKSGALDEGQARPNPGIQDEARLDQTLENLKLTVDDSVIPEEPASSTGTLSSLQHLAKDFSFGNQFFNDKPLEANNEKTTADKEAESMVFVTIHQDTSVIPPMTSLVMDLMYVPDSPTVHRPLPTTTTATATTTTTIMTIVPLPPQPQQVSLDSILLNRLGEIEQHIADLVDANQVLEERLDKHRTSSCLNLAESRKKKKRDSVLLKHHLALHLILHLLHHHQHGVPSGTSGASDASGSSQSPPPPPPPSNTQGGQSTVPMPPASLRRLLSARIYAAWTMTDTRIKP